MKKTTVDLIIHNWEKELNQIFDCDQKIKSLLSDLRALNVEVEMLRNLIESHNPRIGVCHEL